MNLTQAQKNKKQKEKERAYNMSKQGLTTRVIGDIMGKSHGWVANAINELSTIKNGQDLTDKN
ncbi:MAG: hypothetical protein K9M15_02770 [Candidatus Marinimicrobia bacterium]|nr:hypothetical protein [Candidatus Neomarinimicrobiota bacterium]